MAKVESIFLYGVEIRTGAMEKKEYSSTVLAVQRRATLELAYFYRTESETAVTMRNGVTPIDLLA